MRPVIIVGVIVLVAAMATAFWLFRPNSNAGDTSKLNRSFTPAEQQLLDTVHITAGELATATCEAEQRCWIAVNKVVYDVSSVPSWAKGTHHGVKPGHDVTDSFVKSGHPLSTLQKLPVVGSLEA